MRKFLIASLITLFFANWCYADGKDKYAGFEKTAHGIPYKIYTHGTGTANAKVGDWVEMHIQQIYGETDTLLIDTRKMNNNQPVQVQLHPAQFDGDIPEGFTYMREGDSAVFLISTDTLQKKMGSLPPFFHLGNFLEFHVVMVSIKSDAQVKQEQKEKAAKQIVIDDKLLQDYFTKNNIKPTKTATGLYYTMAKKGTGPLPKVGQQVTVKYTGKLLDGTVFDSDVDSAFHHTDPLFSFTIGKHQVIPGWDEGMALYNKGGKGTLYVPSTLAYGDKQAGQAIPPNTVLLFDVEITDIKDLAPQQAPNTQPTTPVKTQGRKMNVNKGK